MPQNSDSRFGLNDSLPEHGGNLARLAQIAGIDPERLTDFSANINPLGPPEWFRPVVSAALEKTAHYPDPKCLSLLRAASERYGAPPEELAAGNGSTELLSLLPRVLGKRKALIFAPSYTDYVRSCRAAGLEIETIQLREDARFTPDFQELLPKLVGDECVFICNPNNPTGLLLDAHSLRTLAAGAPDTVFVIDEAFGDFVPGFQSLTRNRPPNVVVMLSLTKIFCIPGLRLGLMNADRQIIAAVKDIQPNWSVNTLALAVGEKALLDREYVEKSREYVTASREALVHELGGIKGFTVFPGAANFLFVRIDRPDLDVFSLAEKTLSRGIAVRNCANFTGLDARFFRVAVRTRSENERLCEVLSEIFGADRPKAARRTAKSLMVQGASSNAGKSVLTAALCRILLQDGFRVAPFKAQNMSLNSFVTGDGGEMGRAQVTQAQACRLNPDVRMNPVLLKPNSDTGSQVIVNGRPVGNMDVKSYVHYKPAAFDAAKAAYDSLAAEFDVMVLEGAGSPAEINLKHHDIVNMQMAEYAKAPVLIVGDIDRGGVFASFIGTMETFAAWERALTAGFIINRFRGDASLLDPAIAYTERYTGRPFFGVVPYLHNLGLPEEDSVSFKADHSDGTPDRPDYVEIALIDIPHISNFTDFDALRSEPDVRFKIVRRPEELNSPDAIILPGSKNTIGDLETLRREGMADRIRAAVNEHNTQLVGICGGFQMLGREIADPHCLETSGRSVEGLGFLDIVTVLALEKTLTRFTGVHRESGLPVFGYEIHHGVTESGKLRPLLNNERGGIDGAISDDGKVWGAYVHGIFDADEFRRTFIDGLRVRRGLKPLGAILNQFNMEPALDRLAETVRVSLNMPKIYQLLGV